VDRLSTKFLIDLNDKQIERLDTFQKRLGCTYRIDAIRALIDLLIPQDDSDQVIIISAGQHGIALLKACAGSGSSDMKPYLIDKEHHSEITEWESSIHYDQSEILLHSETKYKTIV
jgi:NADH/NAD ratio-sensing transcriptional regulator Rex